MSRPVIIALIATLIALVTAQATKGLERNVLTVTGVGTRSTPSTIAVISLAVEREGKTAVEVQKALAEGSTSLLEFLRAANVSEIETSGVSLNTRRNFSENPAPIIGYTGRNSITFETGIKESGPILDGAIIAGASQVSGVTFKATNEATMIARSEAIADAVASATQEAKAAGIALGKMIGEAVNVSITDRFTPQPRESGSRAFAALKSSAAAASFGSEIVGRDLDITATVKITFELA